MHIALFTPTHNPKYLHEAYLSISHAAIRPYKLTWYIGYNGTVTPADLPVAGEHTSQNSGDSFAIVHVAQAHVGVIGALKRELCDRAIADGAKVVVEFDHDDLLAATAIQEIGNAFARNPAVGFVYSDFTEFVDFGTTWQPYTYHAAFGWQSYPSIPLAHEPRSNGLFAMRAFAPSARAVCDILFAPNHVRAWRSNVYTAIGGHDKTMDVCDDHDLVVRTYLATQMHHIEEPIYFYRRHPDGGNSFMAKVDKIQALSAQLRSRYLHALVERECALKNYAMLDLGGSTGKPAGWLSVDLANADIVHDLSAGLPDSPDGRPIGAVRAVDFLEHLPMPVAMRLFQSVYDKLVPGGWFLTRTPHSSGLGAECDPTHVSRWNEASFLYHTDLVKRQYLQNQLPWLTCRYQRVRLHVEHVDISCNGFYLPPVPYVVADLCALKNQRHTGPAYI